ncbi:MAG: MFS transporter [Rhodospirillales bacterium]|nr:MFS transporter [Rhodospirillales bacterium]
MASNRDRRNVAVLSLSQALFMTGQSTLIILSGLVGQTLTATKALATLPVSMVVVATALTTIPASMLMKRVGRRSGFMLGALFAIVGAVISSYAIWIGSFWLFVTGTFVIGVNGGFAQFYRFAAADAVDESFRAKAISLVVAGGIVAAFAGPTLVKLTNELFAPVLFLGAYLSLIVVAIIALGVLMLVDIPKLSAAQIADPGRPVFHVMRQPVFIVAVIGGMVGYASMSLVMTAAPIAMVGCGFAVSDAATVIQWHIVAMFLPSFFTGTLIQRFGVLNVMLAGLALLAGCVVAALAGLDFGHFVVALIALGLGWNFAFVGASTLLTESYTPAERAKTQAANDFLVFGSVAMASLSSGAFMHFFGWDMVQLLAIPFVAFAALAVGWLSWRRAHAARRAA